MTSMSIPCCFSNATCQTDEEDKPRRSSEIEMRAKRSSERLTVPDWFKNRRRGGLKMLTDPRPIMSRPSPSPSWKSCQSTRTRMIKLCKKHVAAMEAGETPILTRTAQLSPRPELDMRGEIMKLSAAYSKMHVSKTLPTMSRSRKMENLNLIFPPLPTEKLDNLEEDEMVINTDSVIRVEEFAPAKKSSSEDQEPPEDNVDDNEVSSWEISSLENIDQILPLATSTLKKFNCPVKTQGEKWQNDIEEILADSKTKSEETEKRDNFLADEMDAEDHNRFFVSSRESSVMETIIQRHKQRSPTRSFVQEIIEELNAKCRDPETAMASYLSSISANFVKKLVEALECKEDDEKENRPIWIPAKSSGSGFCSKDPCSRKPRPSCSYHKASGSRTKRSSYSYKVPTRDRNGEMTFRTCTVEGGAIWMSLPKAKKNNGQKRGGSCIRSPQADGQDGWGRTFVRNRKANPKKGRFHDPLVADSGFCEGARAVPCVSSLLNGLSLNDKDTTCTEKETDNTS